MERNGLRGEQGEVARAFFLSKTRATAYNQRMMTFLRAHKLALVLILALALRLAILFAFPSLFAFDQTGTVHGSTAYDTYAQHLLASGVYGKITPGVPDAHLPPLYSYLLALVYGIFGRGYLPVALMHIGFDLAAIVLLYHLCRRLFPHGEAVGALAGLFYAAYPYLIFQNLTLIDTPFFMLLLYGFLLLMAELGLRARFDREGWALALLGGVVLGLLALTRTNAVIVALVVALWIWSRAGFKAAVGRLLPVALISALTIAPWIVRNYQVFDTFVPVALNGGENFYQGNNQYTVPYFRAGYDVQWVPPPEGIDFADRFGPEANAARQQAGLDYLSQHPEAIPELLWIKFLIHWSIDIAPLRNPAEGETLRLDFDGSVIVETDDAGALALGGLPPGDAVGVYSSSLFDQLGRSVHRLYYGGLFVLALLGILVSARYWREVSLLWWVQIAMMVVYILFHPSTRYRAPTDPLLFAFSACALVYIWLRVRGRQEVQRQYAHG